MPVAPGVPPVRATLKKKDSLPGGEYFAVEFEAREVADRAVPGQFVHLKFPDRSQPLLRRPLSIAGAANGVITVLFKRKGAFTNEMARMREGETVDMHGPLGRGYDLSFPPVENAWLVAGGYGIAPLIFLAGAIRDGGKARTITLVEGAHDRAALVWADRAEKLPWLSFVACTEDGSVGRKGTALDALGELIRGREAASRLFACGPMGMLAAINSRWPGVPFQAAVENQMGCGFGVCQGCVLPAKGKSGMERFVRVCLDGPVFEGNFIDWEECPK